MKYFEYQELTEETADYPKELRKTYLSWGLKGEVGEMMDKFKKLIRDCGWNPEKDPYCKNIPKEKVKEIKLEMGDIMWYCAQIDKWIYKNENIENFELYMAPNKKSGYSIKILLDNLYIAAYYSKTSRIKKELNFLAEHLECTLGDICSMNYAKLISRKVRNTLHGEGDFR